MVKTAVMPLPSQDDITYKCIKIEGETVAIPLCIFACARGKNAELKKARFIFENGVHWYICESEYENRMQIERDFGEKTFGVVALLDCPDKAKLCSEAEKSELYGPISV